MTQVSLLGLGKTYPGSAHPALSPLSLDLPSGSLTALLGPSGCGKTTALRLIAGLLPPSQGDIVFDGQPVLHDPPDKRGVVMVFQNPLLFPSMTVAENVAFGLRMRHLPRTQITARVADMLALVKLPDLGARRPSQLSGGQQQRVALARALIVGPKVLLLDEPLSNLDAGLRVEMRDLIRSLQRQLAITTLFVTHDQAEAVELADRIALVLQGRLCQVGPPEHFYARPATEAVARFFGGQNFLPGHSDGAVFHAALGPLTLPAGASAGPGVLTIRPESIRLGQGADNARSATVVDRRYLGTQIRLQLRVSEVELEAMSSPDQAQGIAIGQTIAITLPAAHLWMLP